MDQKTFDRITCLLGTRKSRRLALSALATARLSVPAFVAARDGALGGDKGGRRGPDHRGQDKKKRRRADRRAEDQPRGGNAKGTCKGLRHSCSAFTQGDCCRGLTCMASAILPLTFCQQGCSGNTDCNYLLDSECRFDAFDCPFLKCCRPK